MSELLKLEFIDRERTFIAEIPDEFWPALADWCQVHGVTKEQTLGKMLHSFCAFMLEDLEHHKNPSTIPGLVEEILGALGIEPTVQTSCSDCGQSGFSNEHPLGRIVLCTSCLNKRKEGKTSQEFLQELRELVERRHRER